jgi:hypothetical protein
VRPGDHVDRVDLELGDPVDHRLDVADADRSRRARPSKALSRQRHAPRRCTAQLLGFHGRRLAGDADTFRPACSYSDLAPAGLCGRLRPLIAGDESAAGGDVIDGRYPRQEARLAKAEPALSKRITP